MVARAYGGCAVLALAVLQSCATVRVKSTYDSCVDFSRYQTFEVLEGRMQDHTGDDREGSYVERIGAALKDELTQRGLTEAVGGSDLAIGFVAGWPEHKCARPCPQRYTWPNECGPGVCKPLTLVVDFIDTRTRRTVWQACCEIEATPGQLTPELIRKAVAKALRDFPPEGASCSGG